MDSSPRLLARLACYGFKTPRPLHNMEPDQSAASMLGRQFSKSHWAPKDQRVLLCLMSRRSRVSVMQLWSPGAHLSQASSAVRPSNAAAFLSRTSLTSEIHRLVTPAVLGCHSRPALHAPAHATADRSHPWQYIIHPATWLTPLTHRLGCEGPC